MSNTLRSEDGLPHDKSAKGQEFEKKGHIGLYTSQTIFDPGETRNLKNGPYKPQTSDVFENGSDV